VEAGPAGYLRLQERKCWGRLWCDVIGWAAVTVSAAEKHHCRRQCQRREYDVPLRKEAGAEKMIAAPVRLCSCRGSFAAFGWKMTKKWSDYAQIHVFRDYIKWFA
jgi:hypothetical protein